MAYLELMKGLGMSDAEAEVYLSLLELGPSAAGPIIKKTGLHRATAYQVLQRLQEKGLVSSVIDSRRHLFTPASPKRLLDVLQEKQDALSKALPKLEAFANSHREKQEVTVYHGVKGVRSVLDRLLDEVGPGGEYYDFGVSGMLHDIMGPYWYIWQGTKKKRSITSYVIFDRSLKKSNPAVLREYVGKYRFHPKEYSSLTDTFIYEDTVAMVIWTAKPPIAVVIKNSDNARSYRNQFWLMWKKAEKGRE